jgi:hypothetical protein
MPADEWARGYVQFPQSYGGSLVVSKQGKHEFVIDAVIKGVIEHLTRGSKD